VENQIMKSPFWILNSALIIIFIGTCGLLWVLMPHMPTRQPLKIPEFSMLPKLEEPKINLATIYERDPFGTYSLPEHVAEPPSPLDIPMPTAPTLPHIAKPMHEQPTFLPPLAIVLKGIMASSNEQDNRAIIADEATKKEELYKVGDSVLDAELIRIESNKIILIRSNGQQETVFMTSPDAAQDPLYQQASAQFVTTPSVRKISTTSFAVDPNVFSSHIMNLAQFIEILDITAVFDQGTSIGCRIGSLTQPSIGTLLGLQTGDIITEINGIPTTSAKSRINIYQDIAKMKIGDTITTHLIRDNTPLIFTYILEDLYPKKNIQSTEDIVFAGSQANAQKIYKQAGPTRHVSKEVSQKIHKQNKHAMFEHGGSSLMAPSTPINQ